MDWDNKVPSVLPSAGSKGESNNGRGATPNPPTASRPTPMTSYANRAASAIEAVKAPGAFARLGKVLYPGSGSSTGTGATPPSSSKKPEHLPMTNIGVRYTAKSSIIAMDANRSERNIAAIAGKDFLRVLKVEDGVSIEHDLKNKANFDKLYIVTCLKWGNSPFDKTIALGNSGGTVRIFNVDKQYQIQQLVVSNRAVNSIAFALQSTSGLYVASSDGIVRLWDLRESGRKPVLAFGKTGDIAREVKCSPFDGHKFAVIYDSGTVQRWDTRYSSSCDRRINAHTGVGLTLDWHPDLDYIATGGRDQQVQVWNMSVESRKPDYMILSPSPVGKVRWSTLHAGSNGSAKLQNCMIVSCGRSKSDTNAYVWSLSRPNIPRQVLEDHTDTITDLCPRSDRLLWSASKDKTFVQHDLLLEPYTLDNLTSSVSAWSPRGDVAFVEQERHGIQSGTREPPIITRTGSSYFFSSHGGSSEDHSPGEQLGRKGGIGALRSRPSASSMGAAARLSLESFDFGCALVHDFGLPCQDASTFAFLARNYQLYVGKRETLVDICLANCQVAFHAQRYRTAQVWNILGLAVSDEQRRFVSENSARLPAKIDLSELVTLRSFKSRLCRTDVCLCGTSGPTPCSLHPAPTTNGAESFKPQLSDVPPESSDEGEERALGDAPGITVDRSQSKNIVINSKSLIAHSPTSDGSSAGVTSISPEDFYGRAGTSFTRLPMTSKFGTSVSSGGSSADDIAKSFSDWRSHALEDIEEASEVPTPRNNKSVADIDPTRSSLEVKPNPGSSRLTHALESLVITPDKEQAHEIRDLYLKFLQDQTYPWRTEQLLKRAFEYSLSQGDIQLCAILVLLFCNDYPNFCASLVAEEVVVSYVTLLKRHCLFSNAAEVVKLSDYEPVRILGQMETSLDTLCARCKHPLSENANALDLLHGEIGFWYCAHCKNLLHDCSICQEPIRGLGVVILKCGHECHNKCMRAWFYDLGMNSCPTGCGVEIRAL